MAGGSASTGASPGGPIRFGPTRQEAIFYFSYKFCRCLPPISALASLLGGCDRFGWQISSNRGNPPANNIFKPAGGAYKWEFRGKRVAFDRLFLVPLTGREKGSQGDRQEEG